MCSQDWEPFVSATLLRLVTGFSGAGTCLTSVRTGVWIHRSIQCTCWGRGLQLTSDFSSRRLSSTGDPKSKQASKTTCIRQLWVWLRGLASKNKLEERLRKNFDINAGEVEVIGYGTVQTQAWMLTHMYLGASIHTCVHIHTNMHIYAHIMQIPWQMWKKDLESIPPHSLSQCWKEPCVAACAFNSSYSGSRGGPCLE